MQYSSNGCAIGEEEGKEESWIGGWMEQGEKEKRGGRKREGKRIT